MGRIRISCMTSNDFDFAIRVTDTMDWDLTEKDFQFMMALEPKGCFIALDDSEKIGIITTISFDKVGWIGNVIVNHKYRSKGIGSLLMKHAMNYLIGKSVTTIGLYSYPETVSFYERLGFKKNSNFFRLVGHCSTGHPYSKTPKRMFESDLLEVINLDKLCFHGFREKLLRHIFMNSRDLCYVSRGNEQLVGFIMADFYRREIGPWACQVDYNEETINLLQAVLNKLAGMEVHIGVPEKKQEILDKLQEMEFKKKFKVVRMYYGESLEDSDCLIAMESLERG
jgi:GNAT superfamily N-acetyltransferase